MPKGTLKIRRQIRSIGNTKKMTKAMELVSASKMRRSTSALLAARPYAQAAEEVVEYLAARADAKLHPLLQVRPVRKLGIIVIGTNRGLCGGFNANIAAKVNEVVREHASSTVQLFTVGKRGREYCLRSGHAITADFPKSDVTRSILDIAPVITTVVEQYQKEELDKVVLVTTQYVSSVSQRAFAKRLLPFSSEKSVETLESVMFEPAESSVLEYMIPRLLETTVFRAVLESEASEHSARMLAMHNASEAATDMLYDLQLAYNQIRQAAITQEIAEISSGRAALE